jgi:GNAT superfamily N-acetyltransferase
VVEGGIAASVLLQRQGDAAYFGMFVVQPGLQGAGLGRRMIDAAGDFARRTWDAGRLSLTAIHLRPELIAYYERRGFRRTGELLPFPAEAAARAKVEGIELAVLEKPLAG